MMDIVHKQGASATAVTLLALIGLADLALIAGSLRWPMPTDAGVFHFAASQFLQGAVPYRDLLDVNQPLTYWLHEAILRVGGSGDAAFRIFDLLCTALVAAGVYIFCAPAGRIAAAIGAGFLVAMHLTFGMASAGQRDFMLLAPLLASAILGVRAHASPRAGWAIALSGVMIGVACLIKPTAILAAVIPFAAVGRVRWREVALFAAGGALIAALAAAWLAMQGGLQAFFQIWRDHGAVYAQFEAKPASVLAVALVGWLLRLSGFGLAVALGYRLVAEPRMRAALVFAVFGAAHFWLQRKGYYYHVYPLICGVVLAGAVALPRLRQPAIIACAILIAAFTTWRAASPIVHGVRLPLEANEPDTSAATAGMSEALTRHFARGSRIQLLDSDSGGFLAMARAGMRQATPDAYWFLVLGRDKAVQDGFVERLRNARPEGLLLTNTQWPVGHGFEGLEQWSELKSLVDAGYREVERADDWRLYQRR